MFSWRSVKFLQSLIVPYALFILTWFNTNRLIQDTWWPLVLLDMFAEYFLLSAAAVFLASLLSKRLLIVTIASIPLLLQLYFYASFFFPITSPTLLEENQRFRVATFNIWNHSVDLAQIVEVIKTTQADVIALQEITEVQRAQILAGLQHDFPHHHISQEIFGGTTALFSKHPLVNIKELDIQVDRPAIVADLLWGETRLTVVSAHLNPSFWARWRQPWHKVPGNYHQYIKDQGAQVESILTELDQRSESGTGASATFLACDCNSQETASTNRRLRRTLQEALQTAGWQLGETGDQNLRFERDISHIDYVWFSGHATLNAVYRGSVASDSDHDPVIADFVLN